MVIFGFSKKRFEYLFIILSGLPRIDAFPIEELSFKARDPISGELKEFSIKQETNISCPIGLNQAQQYGNGLGLSPLRDFFYNHTKQLHKPCYEDWNVIPTAGNTDSLYKMLSLFLSRVSLFSWLAGVIQLRSRPSQPLDSIFSQLILMKKA